jgi:hypothetical protein
MYENLPLITLEDLDADQVITNGRKSSYDSLSQDNENFLESDKDDDTENTVSDGNYYDDNQKSLDIQEGDDDPVNFSTEDLNENDMDLLDDPSDEDDGSDDDDEYGYIIENED